MGCHWALFGEAQLCVAHGFCNPQPIQPHALYYTRFREFMLIPNSRFSSIFLRLRFCTYLSMDAEHRCKVKPHFMHPFRVPRAFTLGKQNMQQQKELSLSAVVHGCFVVFADCPLHCDMHKHDMFAIYARKSPCTGPSNGIPGSGSPRRRKYCVI